MPETPASGDLTLSSDFLRNLQHVWYTLTQPHIHISKINIKKQTCLYKVVFVRYFVIAVRQVVHTDCHLEAVTSDTRLYVDGFVFITSLNS